MSERKSTADRQTEIVAAAVALAFEVGPDHVSTGMIAARLGLKQPAIYKHFPHKQDIWNVVSDEICTSITDNIAARLAEDRAPMDRARHLVLSHFALVARTPALPELMIARDPTGALTHARQQIQTVMNHQFRAALAEDLGQAKLAGQLRSDLGVEESVALLFGVIQGMVLRLILGRDPTSLVQVGTRLLDLQLALLSSAGETP